MHLVEGLHKEEISTRAEDSIKEAPDLVGFRYFVSRFLLDQPSGGFHPQPNNVQQPHGFNQPNNFNRGPSRFFLA